MLAWLSWYTRPQASVSEANRPQGGAWAGDEQRCAGKDYIAAVENKFIFACVAQLVEQRIRNAKVGSSSLLTGTIS